MISFDIEIRWNEYYIRNNRTKNQKHIRCFPNHLNGIHKEKGFCGSCIKVFCDSLQSNVNDYVVVGCFEKSGSLSQPMLNTNSEYEIEMFNYDEESESPFYLGNYSEEESEKNNKPIFIINSSLISWRYAETINKSTKIKFTVYLLIKDKIRSKYKVINEISSPLFVLKSSRHLNKADIISSPISPVVFNDEKLPIHSPINIINSKTIEKGFEIDKEEIDNNILNNKEKEIGDKSYIVINNLNKDMFPFEIYSDSPKDLYSYHIKDPTSLPKPIYVIEKKCNEENNNEVYDNETVEEENQHKQQLTIPSSLSDIKSEIEEQLPPENDFSIPPLIMNITEPLSPDFENAKIYSPKPAQLKSAYEVKIKKPTGIHDLCRMIKSLDISDNKKEKKKRREEFDFMGRNVYEPIKDDSTFYRQIDSKGNVTVHIPMFSITKPN